jgi:hypothetical protein
VQIKGLESDYASVQLTKLEQGSVYDMDASEHGPAGHAGQDSGESVPPPTRYRSSLWKRLRLCFRRMFYVVVDIVPRFAA